MNGIDAEHYAEDQAVEDACLGTYRGSPIRSDMVQGIDLIYFDAYIDALIFTDTEPQEDHRYLMLRPNGEKRVKC